MNYSNIKNASLKNLSRRQLIKSFGLIGFMATPLLRQTRAFAADLQPIYIQMFKPNGSPEGSYFPNGSGNAIDFNGKTNQILNDLKEYVIVPKGLRLYKNGGNPHSEPMTRLFSNGKANSTTGDAMAFPGPITPSIDQIIADHLYKKKPSLLRHLHFSFSKYGGRGGLGYGGNAVDTVSFYGDEKINVPVHNILTMYDSIFNPINKLCGNGAPVSAASPTQLAKKSVLDYNLQQIASAKQKLGLSITESAKLDDFAAQLRMLERNLADVATQDKTCPQALERNDALRGAPRAQVILDLLLLAIEWELTNVASFQFGSAQDYNAYNDLNLPKNDNHHGLSHTESNDVAGRSSYGAISDFHWNMMGGFLKKLKERQTIDGRSLLDLHLALVSGGEISEGVGNDHRVTNMSFVMVGKANGAFKHTGYTLQVPAANNMDSHARLLLSACHAMGRTDMAFVGEQSKCPGGPLIAIDNA